jgi:hypothetical protein
MQYRHLRPERSPISYPIDPRAVAGPTLPCIPAPSAITAMPDICKKRSKGED